MSRIKIATVLFTFGTLSLTGCTLLLWDNVKDTKYKRIRITHLPDKSIVGLLGCVGGREDRLIYRSGSSVYYAFRIPNDWEDQPRTSRKEGAEYPTLKSPISLQKLPGYVHESGSAVVPQVFTHTNLDKVTYRERKSEAKTRLYNTYKVIRTEHSNKQYSHTSYAHCTNSKTWVQLGVTKLKLIEKKIGGSSSGTPSWLATLLTPLTLAIDAAIMVILVPLYIFNVGGLRDLVHN